MRVPPAFVTPSGLSQVLTLASSDHVLWIDPSDRAWTVAEAVSAAKNISFDAAAAVVDAGDPHEFMLRLLAADACGKAIIIPPTFLETTASARWLNTAREMTGSNCAGPRRDGVGGRSSDWILGTSGTSGIPKHVRHTFTSLTRHTSFDRRRGASHVWSSLYNLGGFAGLQVLLQAICGGSAMVCHHPEDSLRTRIARMARHGVTALSATPTMWRKLLMLGDITATVPLRQITLGGEIADQKILDALSCRFPEARIRQIYASTEAGVGFSVGDGRAGFPRTWLDSPPNHTELCVLESRLWVRHAAADANRKTEAPIDAVDATKHGWIDTEDLVQVAADRIHFLGRENGCINVGGNKVQPEFVEQFLREIPGVHEARVYSRPNPFTGSVVAAEIVVPEVSDAAALKKRVQTICRAELEAFQVPAWIQVVDQIDVSSNGKLSRAAA